ncbi:MAG: TIM barrel protein [Thermomicrobiales bacterium]|nr:TIM barrel protein [Thermomicrobiales bacterium]
MFIGCSTNGFYPQLSPIAALTAIGMLGFTHAELTLYHRRHYTEAAFRACGQAARAAGVSIDVVHLEPNEHRAFDPDRAVVTEAWENFDRAIAGAARIGAKTVIWQGPMRAEYPIEAGFDPFLEVLYELDCRCQNAGIRLAIENTSVMMLSTLRDLMAVGPRLPSGVG